MLPRTFGRRRQLATLRVRYIVLIRRDFSNRDKRMLTSNSCSALGQVLENRPGGEGRAIGEALLEDPLEELPIHNHGAEVDSARARLCKLVRSCGQLERSRRPTVGDVLEQVKGIYDSLSGSGERSCQNAPLPPPRAWKT